MRIYNGQLVLFEHKAVTELSGPRQSQLRPTIGSVKASQKQSSTVQTAHVLDHVNDQFVQRHRFLEGSQNY
jgi:hypothetical protein